MQHRQCKNPLHKLSLKLPLTVSASLLDKVLHRIHAHRLSVVGALKIDPRGALSSDALTQL
jgi:hypothetical protein